MSKKDDIRRATEMLFDERKNFILIGLTGRTGSGCSSVARLLEKPFESLCPPPPKQSDFNSNEERKYRTVYNYARENWNEFTVIKVRNLITSFVLQEDYKKFINFITKFQDKIKGLETLKNTLESQIKDRFNELNLIMKETIKKFEDDRDTALLDDEVYNFYFKELAPFTMELYKWLNEHQPNLSTFLYQKFGNNIRTSGTAYENSFKPKNIFNLSRRINAVIKILRKRNIEKGGRVLVVIDAFRNPFEVTFFKDRYSAFYLFSVNTENKMRQSRLFNRKFNLKQIKELDNQEYPTSQKGIDEFSSQNIQKCIELSDVYLYNPTIGTEDYSFLIKQIIKYITLIMHPGLITPTHVERCMQIANNAKLNSGCLSRQVGAVVTDGNFSIKSVGWNSVPEGQITCNLRSMDSLLSKSDKKAFSNFELNDEEYQSFISNTIEDKIENKELNGRLMPYCFKDAYNSFEEKKNQVHTRALHAEENAFLQITKYGGTGIKGGFLFSTASPCELCSKKAYQLGIKTIYYIDPYPGISYDHILENGENRPKMKLFQGAVGKAYTQLYTQFIPYKDEIYMLSGLSF